MNVVAREFNALAGEYETNRLASWYKAHAHQVLEVCPRLNSGDILDVGCGTGYLLRSYLRRNPGVRGVGMDIAEEMVEQARQLASSGGVINARFIQGDWENPNDDALQNGSFQLAFCINAFHYFSSPRQAAERFFDILTDDGCLYLLERNKSNSILTRLWGWLHRNCIKDNVEFYTAEELKTFFTDAGFKTVNVVRSVNRLLWKNKLYTSLVLIKCAKN